MVTTKNYGKPMASVESINLPEYVRVILTTDSHGRKRQLLIPAALNVDLPKRPRTTFQDFQIDRMERAFEENPFLSEERRAILASTLGITEIQVKVWFQNRRTKARKLEQKVGPQPN